MTYPLADKERELSKIIPQAESPCRYCGRVVLHEETCARRLVDLPSVVWTDQVMGLWDRSRYGWHLYDGHPVFGSAENLCTYLELHPPSNPRDLVIRPFRFEDATPAMPTTDISNRFKP